ncbi:MAG: tetratricopeptide repeat-containing sensor histidine kinase, partial [Cyclobacteriaceae bacterium]|nr:tetratricopeptide repeat-containing sensor histidine kinase [Cyclobacteriaceae bacterium]
KFYVEGIEGADKEGFDERRMDLYNNMGLLYSNYGEFGKSIKYYLPALSFAEKIQNHNWQGIIYNNIGLTYFRMGSYEEALVYYQMCLDLLNTLGLKEDLPMVYANMGLTLNHLNRNKEAEGYFIKVLDCKDCQPSIMMDAHSGLAEYYLKVKDLLQAEQHLLITLEIAKKNEQHKYSSTAYQFLAQVYSKTNRLNKALEAGVLALKEAKLASSLVMKKASYKILSDLYEEQGMFKEALPYRTLYDKTKDSLFNESLVKDLKDSYVEFHRKEAEKIISLKDSQIRESLQFNILLIITIVLSIVLIVIVYRNVKAQKQQNQRLEHLVDKRTSELVESKEELDHFLYRTSHDIRGPLATLKGLLEVGKLDYSQSDFITFIDRLDRTAEALNSILGRLLEITKIHQHIPVKAAVNVRKIVTQYVDKAQQLYTHAPLVAVEYLGNETLMADPDMVEIIVAAMLDNSFKFYDPSNPGPVTVEVGANGQESYIYVRDNGQGVPEEIRTTIFKLFVVGHFHSGAGMGLHLAKLAAESMGGRIELLAIRRPTVFRLTLPL